MKKNNFIYRCEKCNYLKIEPITKKQRILHVLKSALIIIILTTSILGMLSVYNWIQVTDFTNFKPLTNLGSAYASAVNIQETFKSKNEFIPIVNNITKACNQTDELCKSKAVYDVLVKFDYVLGINLNAMEVYKSGHFDCDEGSNLFCTLQQAQGVNCILTCVEDHCWALTKIDGKTYKVDIVNDIFEEKI